MMRTLIFSPFYLANPPQADILQTWLEWQKIQNPECDILLVDGNSAAGFLKLVPDLAGVARHDSDEKNPLALHKGINCVTFEKNTLDHKERALCYAVRAAIQSGYDALAIVNYDILFAHKMTELVTMLEQFKINCVSTLREIPFVMESNIAVMKVSFLRESNFVDRLEQTQNYLEYKLEGLLDPFYKKWFVLTDEKRKIMPEQIAPVHSIARVHNMKLYQAFMRHRQPDWVLPSLR